MTYYFQLGVLFVLVGAALLIMDQFHQSIKQAKPDEAKEIEGTVTSIDTASLKPGETLFVSFTKPGVWEIKEKESVNDDE